MKASHAIKLAGGALIIAMHAGAWAQASGPDLQASEAAMQQPMSTKEAKRANHLLEKQVREALKKTKGLDADMIIVKARGGVVFLSGTVPDRSQAEMAGRVAQGVKGVASVKNGL